MSGATRHLSFDRVTLSGPTNLYSCHTVIIALAKIPFEYIMYLFTDYLYSPIRTAVNTSKIIFRSFDSMHLFLCDLFKFI